MTMSPSPVVALNRAIAIGQRDGAEAGLRALDHIDGVDRFSRYPFYPAAMGEFELRRGRVDRARDHFARALTLARNASERRYLDKRLSACT